VNLRYGPLNVRVHQPLIWHLPGVEHCQVPGWESASLPAMIPGPLGAQKGAVLGVGSSLWRPDDSERCGSLFLCQYGLRLVGPREDRLAAGRCAI